MTGPFVPPVTQHQRYPSLSQSYPVAPVTGIAAGVLATIPYPASATGGAVPIHRPHCVIANSSPFTLLVVQGANLTQIPAFTADDVVVQEVGQQTGITVLPQPTAAAVATGVDTTLYATWYDGDPPGVYPCVIGSGTVPLAQSSLITTNLFTLTGGANVPIVAQPWMQTIAVQVLYSSGTADACAVTLEGASTAQDVTDQWSYFPVNGQPPANIFIVPITGGATGGTLVATVTVVGLSGPLTATTLGTPFTNLVTNRVGQNANSIIAAAGNAVVVPKPPTGLMIRLKLIGFRCTAAGAANGTVTFRGTVSNTGYHVFGGFGATPTADFTACDILLGDSQLADPAEGLNVLNQSGAQIVPTVSYDVIPTPYT